MKIFQDDLSTAVITTKYVLNENSPILFVNHFEDGFWQFCGSENNLEDADYKIISLEEMIEIDSSILEISDLPYEGMAYREDVNSVWIIE
jgi:hypothetical protein